MAVLLALSPEEGSLVCIYSTTLFRAVEVLRGAKRYIYWMQQQRDDAPSILSDNEYGIDVKTVYGNSHNVKARPKTPNSCRGDAPKAGV